ncbi:MAG TPA: thioredoxin family protein [Fimbriimonadaceae bacterium]|nr:thioredoxin family protein [Fimbriimonadaceae bacterium]
MKKLIPLLVALSLAAMSFAQEQAAAKDIYPAPEAAKAEIKEALGQAAKQHKRIILDFGGNWCGDCRALDKYFHEEPNAALLKDNFILVDVNIGQFDKNKDIAETYGVPLEKGVPALAVLDSDGKVLFSQKKGEFESMRRMESSAVTEFLNHWKP